MEFQGKYSAQGAQDDIRLRTWSYGGDQFHKLHIVQPTCGHVRPHTGTHGCAVAPKFHSTQCSTCMGRRSAARLTIQFRLTFCNTLPGAYEMWYNHTTFCVLWSSFMLHTILAARCNVQPYLRPCMFENSSFKAQIEDDGYDVHDEEILKDVLEIIT